MIKYINREISWLKFNARVLQEARDNTVPLIERLRFLGIYSNNLDEFYKVRYATVLRALQVDTSAYNNIIENQSLSDLLEEIKQVVAIQQQSYDRTYDVIIKELQEEGIFFVNDYQIEGEQIQFVENFFKTKLRHTIAVFLWNPDSKTIPELRDGTFYLAVKMTKYAKSIKNTYALIEVPTYLHNRFVILPSQNKQQYIIFLEDIIRYHLKEIFHLFDFDSIEAHSIKISKDAELDIDQDLQTSLMEKISRSVDDRRKGEPVRMVYDREMAPDTLLYLKKVFHLDHYDSLSPGSKYHNKKDFLGFPDIGRPDLEFEPIEPITPPDFEASNSFIDVIRKKDQLIYTPYIDYSVFLKTLREAAIDPKVESIKMTVYRVADDSQIMSALINAAKNGKKVVAVLELRARFDEAANVHWSKRLQDAGATVIFGVPGLKVHSKIGVITYSKKSKQKQIAFVSTGNFHEKTARIYTDFTLLTSHQGICAEIDQIFDFFQANYKIKDYEYLIVSPHETRDKIYALIDQEIHNASEGKPAQINIKVNSLSDQEMIDKLYAASKAGVEVRMVVRGINCLIPGIPGLSSNIQAVSVVDRFLEHPRVYWFKNGGDDLVYISSADLMTRNIDNRVEVSCPILDKKLKKMVMQIFELNMEDNVKGRLHNQTLNEVYTTNDLPPNRSQLSIYQYFKNLYDIKSKSEK
ncbi:MAG: polyphosphate kinase 1 [Weeksellaceae bacterium]|nr:polyphosphate kinase 1 [Weeksellaceae bacterium]